MADLRRWPARPDSAIPVYAGDDLSLRLRFVTRSVAGGVTTDTPVDVTSWGAWVAQARPTAGDTRKVDFTVDTSGAATGTVLLILTDTASATMRGVNDSWEFDAQTTDSSGNVVTRVRGRLDVEWDITT